MPSNWDRRTTVAVIRDADEPQQSLRVDVRGLRDGQAARLTRIADDDGAPVVVAEVPTPTQLFSAYVERGCAGQCGAVIVYEVTAPDAHSAPEVYCVTSDTAYRGGHLCSVCVRRFEAAR